MQGIPDGSTQWVRDGWGEGLPGGRVAGGCAPPGGCVVGESGRLDVVRTTGARRGSFADGLARGESLDGDGSDDADGSNGLDGAVSMDAMADGTVPTVCSFEPLWRKRMAAAATNRARAAMDPPPRTIQRNADAGDRRMPTVRSLRVSSRCRPLTRAE
ncbi:hypothetical protein GCM10023196_093870 [Actinoallomurus vinaceus]|uniref:Uncharacterized protein n=1 Tax=Actinoallomurus vinaceus TaxID=1080074 RepID=A0ABP8UTE0_9ACTN